MGSDDARERGHVRSGRTAATETRNRAGGDRAKSCGTGSSRRCETGEPAYCGASRIRNGCRQVSRSNLGAIDCRAAFARPLDVHGGAKGYEGSAVLLEVAAFVAEGNQEAEDLRRAVVARALLSLGTEQRRHSGDQAALASALELARSEFSYFQGRVEEAKRNKNTEAAVNLGISTRRLLSFMEEAEKLQP